ncbi:S8 family peptidase [Parafilimonas sp.]|uniref:S8 family peptidase n=1 Tax=Parafilimonas sp. TaxID=1969739 RepID=UPI0039E6173C
MASFKVKVSLLNVRTGPVEDFTDKKNVIGKLKTEAPFESIDEKTNKLGTWYKDANQHWVWGEGLIIKENKADFVRPEKVETQPTFTKVIIDAQEYLNKRFDGEKLTAQIDYNFLLNIESTFKNNMGSGIKVAILDTAISKHISFRNKVERPFASGAASDHGTFISGIIAGADKISGIAPNVTLIELPLYNSYGFIQDDDTIKKYFDFINKSNELIILNISQADVLKQFEAELSNLKKCIIVASAGINNDLQNQDLFFPAKLQNAISVGSVTKNFASLALNTSFNRQLNFILPSFNYVSYTNAGQIEFEIDTSSFSTAVITSIVALIAAEDNTFDLNLIRSKITTLAQPYSDKNKIISLNPLIPSK